jgi:DDE superfamily endonuclease
MADPVTYCAVLPVGEQTVLFVSALLAAERRRRGTRSRRALGCYRQAVLVLRWFCDGTRLARLAADNRIGRSTAYRYVPEGIDALATQAPGLRGALLAARLVGHTHVQVDGTLIRTDRCSVPGPTARADHPDRRVDPWWSGQHAAHGGNGQVVSVPDGWPIWTSGVRPGREHDTTALRAHPEALPLLGEWADEDHAVLGDLGYEGEQDILAIPIRRSADRPLTADQRTVNALHAALRALAERGNALLKTTFKALRRVSLCPRRIGAITAAALVLLHREQTAAHDHQTPEVVTENGSVRRDRCTGGRRPRPVRPGRRRALPATVARRRPRGQHSPPRQLYWDGGRWRTIPFDPEEVEQAERRTRELRDAVEPPRPWLSLSESERAEYRQKAEVTRAAWPAEDSVAGGWAVVRRPCTGAAVFAATREAGFVALKHGWLSGFVVFGTAG